MKRIGAIFVCLGLLAGVNAVKAATFSWSGSGGGAHANLWLDGQNWTGGGVPGASDIASFPNVNAANKSITPTINSGQTAPISGILFNSGANAYNVSGAGTLAVGNGITNGSGVTETFSVANVSLTADATFINTTAPSSFNFTGSSLNLGTFTLTVDGPGITTIGNVISGSGNLTKAGAGTLNLNAAETYTGTTTVSAGRLSLGTAQTLTGPVLLSGGTVQINNTGANSFGDLTVNGNAAIDLAASGSVTFNSATWTSGLLTINNWSGPADNGGPNPGGAPNPIFISNPPLQNFLDNVQFVGDGSNGTFQQGAVYLGTGELVPVPEPQVYAAVFALGLLGFAIARRRMVASA